MRLGVDLEGVTELMAVTEHARALSTTAAALLLESLDTDGPALVAPLAEGEPGAEVRERLAEVAAAIRSSMGRDTVPALWRVLARNPHYLESTWRKELVVMGDGVLAARDKRRTALGVAMSLRARYMIEYHAAILRHGGDTDRDVLEVLGVVDHYTTLNTLSDGMQIDSDIRPPQVT
jgi:alkylhydroperoxidase/carboxymuconolactone decarboxylase family protein YurZ